MAANPHVSQAGLAECFFAEEVGGEAACLWLGETIGAGTLSGGRFGDFYRVVRGGPCVRRSRKSPGGTVY